MDLAQIKQESGRLSMWAYLATVRRDGSPHVVPVHPCWDGDTLAVYTGTGSQKVANIRHEPRVALHYTVAPDTGFDHLLIEGKATVLDDLASKQRLWKGVFDYDLDAFDPRGPESPDACFLAITPAKAVVLRNMGQGGREVWRA